MDWFLCGAVVFSMGIMTCVMRIIRDEHELYHQKKAESSNDNLVEESV